MGAVTTQGIVLRHADLRENDRMITLLTPSMGRVDALCRGCKRTNSPLMNCSEWFAFGEYVLFMGKGHATVTSCSLTESYYPLREDYESLRHATLMLKLCEETVQPGQESLHLFTLLARSLGRLAYTARPRETVTAGFLLHYAVISGYAPVLDQCVGCGRAAQDSLLFDVENGGVLCRECASSVRSGFPLRKGQLEWLRRVRREGIDRYENADDDPPMELLIHYNELRSEHRLRL